MLDIKEIGNNINMAQQDILFLLLFMSPYLNHAVDLLAIFLLYNTKFCVLLASIGHIIPKYAENKSS